MKKYIIGIALLLALPVFVLAAFQPATLTNGVDRVAVFTQEAASSLFGQGYVLEGQGLGAAAGTLHVYPEKFLGGFANEVLATSTSGTVCTLKESELSRYGVFELLPNVASATWTLPATSTLKTLLKNIGDSRTWVFQNATTSTGITTTLVAGIGWNLSGVDANVDVIAGAAYTARVSQYMTCYRQSNKDVHCGIQEMIAAD